MAITPTPPGVAPATAGVVPPVTNLKESMRGDRITPHGRMMGGMYDYWPIVAIVLLAVALGFVFTQQRATALPPPSETTGKTDQTLPGVPTPPATITPTVPVTPTQPEPTAPTQP